MRPRNSTVLAALVILASVGSPLVAQSSETAALHVRVIDAATRQPVGGAQVGFPDLALFRLANAAGIAQIAGIPPGTHTLEVTMLGYGKASKMLLLEAHALATGDIALKTDPIEIDGLTVTASAEIGRLRDVGFYNRQRLGFGSQLGPLELASILAIKPSDYFARIPTVELVPAGLGRKNVESRRSCVTMSSFGLSDAQPVLGGAADQKPKPKPPPPWANPAKPNAMAIYLDGVPFHEEIDKLPIDWIGAIEVYVGSEVPMQFSQGEGGHCGVILLWSK